MWRDKLPSRYYTYIVLSNVVVICLVLDAFLTFQQVFAAVSFLTTSRPFHVLLANSALANLLLSTSVVRKVFFGELLPAERVQMHEMFFSVLFSSAIGLSFFSHLLDKWLMTAFVVSGGWRMFHTLATARLDSIERAPVRPGRLVARLAAFLFFASVVDIVIAVNLIQTTLHAPSATVHLLFLVNFSTLSLHTLTTMVKLLLIVRSDDAAAPQPEGEGEREAGGGGFADGATRFYVDAFSSVAEFVINLAFFIAVMRIAFPLHLARELMTSWTQASAAIRGLRRYRKLAANIDQAFPDAKPEELDRDRRCSVCYDDMTEGSGCKRLSCGHCYHKNCLRRWFEKNSSCPYCRKEIEMNVPANRPPAPPAQQVAEPQGRFRYLFRFRQQRNGHVHADPLVRADIVPPPVEPAAAAGELPAQRAPDDAGADGFAVDDALIRRAYDAYVLSQLTVGAPPASLTPAADARASPAPTELAILRARLEAFEAYHAEMQAAERRLQVRLAHATAVIATTVAQEHRE